MEYHKGSTVIISQKWDAKERVGKYTGFPVRDTNDRKVNPIYFAQYRLRVQAQIMFQAHLQQACPMHKGLWESQRNSWIEDFINRGLDEYRARQEGKSVKKSRKTPDHFGCVICKEDPPCKEPTSKEEPPMSMAEEIIDISSIDSDAERVLLDDESKHDKENLNPCGEILNGEYHHTPMAPTYEWNEEVIFADEYVNPHGDCMEEALDEEYQHHIPIAHTHEGDAFNVEVEVDKLCDQFTHSLPRTSKGFRIRLVNYSTSSEGEEIEGRDLNDSFVETTLGNAPCDMPSSSTAAKEAFVETAVGSVPCDMPSSSAANRGYNTHFRGVRRINYAEGVRRRRNTSA